MNEITIPLRYLMALRLFSAEKDVREYINGVAVKDGCLAATNGLYCATIDLPESTEDLPEVTIPNQMVDFFVRKHGRRGLDSAEVKITWTKGGQLELQRNAVKEVGQALEGRYPQYQRVMVEHTEAQGNPQFQWSFLVLFEKAAEILGTPKKSEIKAVLIPNGRNASARVVLPGHPYFNGVVMPIKASAVDAECPYLTYPEELEEESLV